MREIWLLREQGRHTRLTIRPKGKESYNGVPSRDGSEILRRYDVTPDGQRLLLNIPDRPTPLFFLQGLDRVIARE